MLCFTTRSAMLYEDKTAMAAVKHAVLYDEQCCAL